MKAIRILALVAVGSLFLASCSISEKALAGETFLTVVASEKQRADPKSHVCQSVPMPLAWPCPQFCMICGKPMISSGH